VIYVMFIAFRSVPSPYGKGCGVPLKNLHIAHHSGFTNVQWEEWCDDGP
jgi:hypothetical protein